MLVDSFRIDCVLVGNGRIRWPAGTLWIAWANAKATMINAHWFWSIECERSRTTATKKLVDGCSGSITNLICIVCHRMHWIARSTNWIRLNQWDCMVVRFTVFFKHRRGNTVQHIIGTRSFGKFLVFGVHTERWCLFCCQTAKKILSQMNGSCSYTYYVYCYGNIFLHVVQTGPLQSNTFFFIC